MGVMVRLHKEESFRLIKEQLEMEVRVEDESILRIPSRKTTHVLKFKEPVRRQPFPRDSPLLYAIERKMSHLHIYHCNED